MFCMYRYVKYACVDVCIFTFTFTHTHRIAATQRAAHSM